MHTNLNIEITRNMAIARYKEACPAIKGYIHEEIVNELFDHFEAQHVASCLEIDLLKAALQEGSEPKTCEPCGWHDKNWIAKKHGQPCNHPQINTLGWSCERMASDHFVRAGQNHAAS